MNAPNDFDFSHVNPDTPPEMDHPLLFAAFLCRSAQEFLNKTLEDREDLARQREELGNFLICTAWQMSEENPYLTFPKGWTLRGLGRRLAEDSEVRERMLDMTPQERRSVEEDPSLVVPVGFMLFFEDVQDMAGDWLDEMEDEEATFDVDEFLMDDAVQEEMLHWAYFFLGDFARMSRDEALACLDASGGEA